jgi:hypothetical protein
MATDKIRDLLAEMDDRRGEDRVLEDLDALIKMARAVLRLADDWAARSRQYVKLVGEQKDAGPSARMLAQAEAELRAAVSAALTGEEGT